MNGLDARAAQQDDLRVENIQNVNIGHTYATPQTKIKSHAPGTTPHAASGERNDTDKVESPPLDDDYDHTEEFKMTQERAQHKKNQVLLNVYNTFEGVEDSYSHLKNTNCSSRKVQNSYNIYSHVTDEGRCSENVEDSYNHLNESPWLPLHQQPDSIYNNTKRDSK